jgi:hypothetical protein
MENKKFLDTAFSIEKDPKTGGIGMIPYMELEMDSPQEIISKWGTTDSGIEPGRIRLVTKTKFFELKRFQVKTSYPSEMVSDLAKYQGITDTDPIFENVLGNEMDLIILKELYKKYNDLGEMTRASQYTKWQKIIIKIFNETIFTNYIKEDRNGLQKIYNKILGESNKILSRTRINPGNFVVCNCLIGSLLQDHPEFLWEPKESNRMVMTNHEIIYHIGKIAGKIDVFVNANLTFNDGSVIIGRRTNVNEGGVYFVHEPTEKIKIATTDHNGDKIVIYKRFEFVDTQGAEKSFSKVHFTIGNKPLWKKIFNI